ncbi:hypothetical protein NE237_002279 [Protea cynaroides]|uniref:Uncharacterized protein n=1 Tax=Protea cynaroides TaxID=273540 RepID=A0A9Q0QYX1_9MAGN|nr:hypothetical protein NE237_002279 [Protea cynaroides]
MTLNGPSTRVDLQGLQWSLIGFSASSVARAATSSTMAGLMDSSTSGTSGGGGGGGMSKVTETKSWREELASLIKDSGIRYPDDGIGVTPTVASFTSVERIKGDEVEPKSFKDQIAAAESPTVFCN